MEDRRGVYKLSIRHFPAEPNEGVFFIPFERFYKWLDRWRARNRHAMR